MRLSYIQAVIILSLSGLQQAAGAPIGRYSIQGRNEYGTSTAAYYIDDRTPQVASIKARADKDQKQNQLSNKPSSGNPSSGKPPASASKPAPPASKPAPPATKPAPPAAKPIASAAKPPDGQSAGSSSTRPDYETKSSDFNPFNSKDPDYPYTLKQPEFNPSADYDGTPYQMWDITKKAGAGEQCVDQFGLTHDGKNLVIKSARNHADVAINGKKATLAELLLATYKYGSKGGINSANLQAIRIQDVEEKATADLLTKVDQKINPEWYKHAKKVLGRPENMSDAMWKLKKNKLRKEANKEAEKEAASQERPPRITKFDFSDTSNPELYQDLKNSEWGKSVQRICDKFTKQIVRVHVNLADTQSYIIFNLGPKKN